MTDALAPAALYRLMAWLSPSYPVGAFSYSHGIEYLVEDGSITTMPALVAWLNEILTAGSGRNDAILFAAAHRAAAAHDFDALHDIAGHALAFAGTAERHLETAAQGRAFSDITRRAWDSPTLDALSTHHSAIAYPVAVAVACADHFFPLRPALEAYIHAFAANLISAGVRLVPLGHSDGQRTLRAIEPAAAAAVAQGLTSDLAHLSSTTIMADIASMKHETQYTRLFRS